MPCVTAVCCVKVIEMIRGWIEGERFCKNQWFVALGVLKKGEAKVYILVTFEK